MERVAGVGDEVSGDLPKALAGVRVKKAKPIEMRSAVRHNGLMFEIPKPGEPLPEEQAKKEREEKRAQVKRPRKTIHVTWRR